MNNLSLYIAIATFHPLVGGAEKQALAQAKELHKRGHRVTIVTFRYERTWLPYEEIEEIPVIRVAGIFLGGRENLPRNVQKLLYCLALLSMCWTLWRQRRNYDLLHVYQLKLAIITALACRFSGKPMIIGVRCADAGQFEQVGREERLLAGPLDASASWLRVNGPTQVCGDIEGLKRLGGRPAVRLAYFLLKNIEAVGVVLSSRMKGYLATHDFNLPRMQLIPNCVDITRFNLAPLQSSISDTTQVVVCVSQLRYQKGIDVLLQAWRLVQQQIPQTKLLLVGDGPLRAQLENMARELGIVASVEFTGIQLDVASLLQRSNIAVLPSRWEGMPNALLEAMACGLPCVATRVSGSEDMIQHGVNGFLVEPEDYAGLAEALLVLLRNPALAQQFGRTARATIEKNYASEHITDLYITLYQNIVHSRRQPERRGRGQPPAAISFEKDS